LGAYGRPAAKTPNLDRLAAGGTLYTRAYSPVPETLPAHTSMMTGLYPPSHGVRLNLSFRLPSAAETLAERLAQRGFRTAAVTASRVLARRYGLDQGFAVYDDPPRQRVQTERSAEGVTTRALAAADGFGRDRFFLWAHYYDPHSPYEPGEPFAAPAGSRAESPELYALEIAYMDHWIGKLLRGLEARQLLERTAILVAGDHGEGLGEHGETYHTLFVYEATQRVPLLVHGPGVPAGRRVDDLVSPVDVFATALALLGVEPPAGVSSAPLPGLGLGDDVPARRRRVFSESMAPPLRFGWAGLQAVRSGEWLYIRAPREELYDLAADPAERRNLASEDPARLAALRGALGRTLTEMPAAPWSTEATNQPDEEDRAALEALGYLASAAADPLAKPLAGEDPKDLVEVSEAFQLARLARRQDRPETAERLLRFVVAADPANLGGWRELGRVLLSQERFAEATQVLERALELRASDWRARLHLSVAARGLGKAGTAEWHLKEALRATPFPAEVWRELARLKVEERDWPGAAAALREILALEPTDRQASAALTQLESQGVLDARSAPTSELAEAAGDAGPG
jgi:arylsulfatase A-like enzyme